MIKGKKARQLVATAIDNRDNQFTEPYSEICSVCGGAILDGKCRRSRGFFVALDDEPLDETYALEA